MIKTAGCPFDVVKVVCRTLILIGVFAVFSPFEYVQGVFGIEMLKAPNHASISVLILSGIYLLILLPLFPNDFLKISRFSILLLIVPVLFFCLENVFYVFGGRYGRTYTELFFWIFIAYYYLERVITGCCSEKEQLIGIMYHGFLITSCCYCSFVVLYHLCLTDVKFFSVSYLSGSNFHSYIAATCVCLMLFYPVTFSRVKLLKYVVLLIFIATPFVIGNLGGIMSMMLVLFMAMKRWIQVILASMFLVIVCVTLFYSLEIYDYLFFGVVNDGLSAYEVIELNNQLSSTYVRNRTNMLALETFANNPIVGVGLYEIKEVQRFAGYWCHSWLLVILASYGTVGFAVTIFSFLFLLNIQGSDRKEGVYVFLILFMISGLFVAEVYIWYVVPFLLYRYYPIRIIDRY